MRQRKYSVRLTIQRWGEARGHGKCFKFSRQFSFQVILKNLFLQTETRLCGNYSCKSGAHLKMNLVKISQKLIFKPVLNKILSIKSQGLIKQILRKLGFKLSLIEAELNLLDAQKKKKCISTKNSLPLLFIMELSKHNHTLLFCGILDTYNILCICAGGESYAVR